MLKKYLYFYVANVSSNLKNDCIKLIVILKKPLWYDLMAEIRENIDLLCMI
jgi:hypothetical protein